MSPKRSPSGLHLALADRVAQLDTAQWQAATAGASLLEGRNLRPRATDKDAADDDEEASPLRRLFGAVARAAPTRWPARCASACSSAATCSPGADATLAWSGVAEVIYRMRRAEKLAGQAGFVIVKDAQAGAKDGAALLSRVGYREADTEPNMVLGLDAKWKHHGDYLASLASKYRSSVKNRVLAPIDGAGFHVRRFEPDAELGARMHALYLHVHEHADLRPFTLHASYFTALARAAGPRLRCSGIFAGDDTLLGFICTLDDGVQALAYHIGFDRAAAKTLPLYLRLLHATIDDAIAIGASELSFRRTALEPKSRLGAKAQSTAIRVRDRQPMMNRLVQPLLGLAHPDEAPETNPFKAV